jgi:hypothetical protein
MKSFFPGKRDFRSLSVIDLLEAREAYHVHLAHLENVVATAIGCYRIRREDPDANEAKPVQDWKTHQEAPPRTLQNTVVRPWSWPCLLVFVNRWQSPEDLVKQDPDQVVPRFLYMPDGRVVPTCVLLVEQQDKAPPPLQNLAFPDALIGGGYPVLTNVQEQSHIGSIGCMVSNGNSMYALTNRHVTGEEGRPIYSLLHGKRQHIGTSHKNQVGKKLFQDVYPAWPGMRAYSNLDAGLIEVDDLNCWTAQVYGIGEMSDPVDLNSDTISLDLIGCPVRAFGGASGGLVGEIQALFYRYKSIGGFEYISDLLIGPRDEKTPLNTMPGDSGTLWFFDPPMSQQEMQAAGFAGARARRLRPIALQWGGHVLLGERGEVTLRFALATCLSTICRELDVDIIPDWNIGHNEYWGKTGHYKIAAKACELVADPKLNKLLKNNLDVIAFSDEDIKGGQLHVIDEHQFVPLADVADLVWRRTRPQDEANHFADMDQEGQGEFSGKTLLALCQDLNNLSIDVWNRYYDSLEVGDKRGALPFRVWQIYKQMVQFVTEGHITEFICAGGVLSHYVGDACQPLHVSYLHHGRPDHPEEKPVHSKYETSMLDRFAPDLIEGVNQSLNATTVHSAFQGGQAAALTVVDVMRRTIAELPPMDIITAFDAAQGNGRNLLDQMWDTLGDRTISCISAGCVCLASIWASAWNEGGGENIDDAQLGPVNRADLQALYHQKDFAASYRLTDPTFAADLGKELARI